MPMPTLPMLSDEELSPRAAAVFNDIRATRGTEYVNNFWRVLANDPGLLERTWSSLKGTMAPGALDPITKELLYIAVSTANGCEYCIRSHTAAARAHGISDAILAELFAVVGMASQTNRLATGLQVPIDEAFLADRGPREEEEGETEPAAAGAPPSPRRPRRRTASAPARRTVRRRGRGE